MTGAEKIALAVLAFALTSKKRPGGGYLEGQGHEVATPGGHRWARGILEGAFAIEKSRAALARELQFLAAWSWVETQYGRSRLLPPAGRDAHNWGAVMCHSASETACFIMTDQFSDGRKFQARFRVYPHDEEGARDLVKEATTMRPRSGATLARPDATVYRVALAERREGYYGGTCAKEVAAAAAAGRPLDKSACEREAVTGRALAVWDAIKSIAADLGEPVALPLGTFEDALSAWNAQKPAAGNPTPQPAPGGAVGPSMGGEVTPGMVAWSWEVLHSALPIGAVTGPKTFPGKAGGMVPVLARVEWHPPDPPGGPSVWHRGVGLYHVPA